MRGGLEDANKQAGCQPECPDDNDCPNCAHLQARIAELEDDAKLRDHITFSVKCERRDRYIRAALSGLLANPSATKVSEIAGLAYVAADNAIKAADESEEGR